MNGVLIGVIVLAALVIVVLAALNPSARKKEDAAIKAVKDAVGKDNVKVIEPRTTAMGMEPEEAGGLRGMVCLVATDTELMAATWSKLEEWRIDRSTITKVDCEAEDPSQVQKTSILVTFNGPSGEATAKFRLREPVPWLNELGYDWGPDGPPVMDDDEDEDED